MIICEISQNFNNLSGAKELIRLAKENGGDLVKAQLFDSMKLYGKKTPADLSFEQAKELFDYGTEIGIEVFFSVFDVERVRWCEEIGVKRFKVGARVSDVTLIQAIDQTGKTTIISYAPDYDKGGWPGHWQVLYCISQYPASLSALHFSDGMFEDTGDRLGSSDSRGEYHREYDGFSDHTLNLTAAKIALARGAQIIEKHFSLSYSMGVDGPWSMTPADLKELKRWEIICREVL